MVEYIKYQALDEPFVSKAMIRSDDVITWSPIDVNGMDSMLQDLAEFNRKAIINAFKLPPKDLSAEVETNAVARPKLLGASKT